HAEAVPGGQPQIREDHRRLHRLQHAHGLRLIAGFEDDVLLPLQRVPEHRAQRVLVLDDENLGGQRIQPGGTPALRASSSMSAICLLALSMSRVRRASSASAFCRSSAILARWAGSSRAEKSAVSALIWVCKALLNASLRRMSSLTAVIRSRQYFSSFAGSAGTAGS